MSISTLTTSLLQGAVILLFSLVLGTVFGIWRGFDPEAYSPTTFVQVHQGSVRGLNVLLPALGLATLVLVAALAVMARSRPGVLWLYLLAFVSIAAAGLITRFGNQPINEQIMTWSVADIPADWSVVRDRWWGLHLMRVATSFAGELLLIGAILADRSA